MTFTAPAGTAPPTSLFTSALTGTVTTIGNGGVFFDFNNAPQTYTFTGGTFSLTVNDVAVTAGDTVQATGQLTSITTAIPEPVTYGMLLAGLGLIGFVSRRRKQNV